MTRMESASLRDSSTRAAAAALSKSKKLIVRELREGLEVEATSFVGRVQLADVVITVQPKLAPELLLSLFRYAYGLSDLERHDDAPFAIGELFQDVVVQQLVNEVRHLTRRGLRRQYVRREESLSVPRGRILFNQLAQGVPTAQIPCRYDDRSADWLLNRAVLSGLALAKRLTSSSELRGSLARSCAAFADVAAVPMDGYLLTAARRAVDRLAAHYGRVLTIIELLYEAQALTLDDEVEAIHLPGFLYDMNRFFQSLLGRLLRESLSDYDVREEQGLKHLFRYAPSKGVKQRRRPTPRPDFALVPRAGGATLLCDAKYRDLSQNTLPRDMLYQLAMYAMSQPTGATASILYPTTNDGADVERIEIFDPMTGAPRATVALRPVRLDQLVPLLSRGVPRAHRERFVRAAVGCV